MANKSVISIVLFGVAALSLMGSARTDQVDRKQLKDMLTQLGYPVRDLDSTAGKEKYSFTIERGGLNIPVAAEISNNGKYIWLTVFCKAGEPVGDKAITLLHKNADIQPTQFYLTESKKLMLGLCIENHEVTNASLRDRAEKIVDDVVNTKDIWQ
jgi:hypothetical protein